jgi:hypothetical protein
MKKRSVLSVVVLIALFAVGFYSFQKTAAGGPARDVPATSTIADVDPVSGAVYRIGSDNLGSYKNGVNSVVSIVQAIGDWELDTKSSTLRKVRVDLGDQVPGSGPAPPFQSAVLPVRFISKCTTSMFTLTVGQTIACPLAMSIVYNGTTYALRSDEPTAPGTDPVNWTCRAASSGKCTSFEMKPSVVQADGQLKNKMTLLKVATKNNQADTPLAQYYMSFDVDVTTP